MTFGLLDIKLHGKREPSDGSIAVTAWRCYGFAPSPMSSRFYSLYDQRKEHGQRTPYLVSIAILNA